MNTGKMPPGTGGLPPRPINAPPAASLGYGVQPGTQNGVVLAQYVIVFGANAGLFIYEGAPSKGNPPILSISDSSKDPFGNTITPSLSLSALPLLVYAAAPASNDLSSSMAPTGGVDNFGNDYVPGIATYNESTGQIVQLFDGQVLIFAPGLGSGSGTQADIAAQAAVFPNAGGSLIISGAGEGSNAVGQMVLLDSAAQGNVPAAYLPGTALILGNPNNVTPDAVNALPVLFANGAAGGHANYVSFDGNTYDMGRLSLSATATPQTINTTGAETITGCSGKGAAFGTYNFRAVVQYKGNQAAGTANFSVLAPSGASGWISAFFGQGASTFGHGVQSAALGNVDSPTLGNGVTGTAIIEGQLTLGATSGTIALQAACSASADTYAIENAKFDLEPVTA